MSRGDGRLSELLHLPPERLDSQRRRALLEAATPRTGFARVKARAWPIAQTAAAASVAWLGAGRVLSTEAGVSGVLVVTLAPESYGFPPTRLIDALCGGAVALLFSQVLFPVHPLRLVRDAATKVLDEFAATITEVAAALEQRDLDDAEHALARARAVNDYWSSFAQALDISHEAVRYSPRRRRFRAEVASYREAGLPLDLLVVDLRVLARTAVRALLIEEPVPEDVVRSLRDLGDVAERLSGCIGQTDASEQLRGEALGAARLATDAAEDETSLSINVLA